ncbi:hypothetical protein HKW98_11685 [Stutzerimonas urumqiensis]|uniref:hypothetical protein n=1 Tax=Stutzerimonas urumqiensis TaxID=638269 RepID=UPI003BAB8A00
MWQELVTHMLRQSRFQLMLEVGLAGRTEERHVYAPLDLVEVMADRARVLQRDRFAGCAGSNAVAHRWSSALDSLASMPAQRA